MKLIGKGCIYIISSIYKQFSFIKKQTINWYKTVLI